MQVMNSYVSQTKEIIGYSVCFIAVCDVFVYKEHFKQQIHDYVTSCWIYCISLHWKNVLYLHQAAQLTEYCSH